MLRVRIPQGLFLYSVVEDELRTVSVSFVYRRYAMLLTFEGGTVEKADWTKPDELEKWYRSATHAILVIKQTDRSPKAITNLITPTAHESERL